MKITKPLIGLGSVCALAITAFAADYIWDYSFADSQSIVEPQLPTAGTPETAPPANNGALMFRVYHVDFDSGNDANSGTSPASPWKRAPGDPLATAKAASTVLNQGDIVRFRGGVRYRGAITLKSSGANGKPILYTGAGFGSGQAILDGADPVTSAVPCPSKTACGNAANWQNLLLVSYAQPATANLRFYDQTGPLFEAQSPAISDPFREDAAAEFAQIPSAQYANILAGQVEDAALANAVRTAKNPRLLFWVTGNIFKEKPVLSVSGNVIHFDPTGVTPYQNDIRISVLGSVAAVTVPGTYASIGAGKAVAYPRVGGGTLSIGNGRGAFDLRGRSNITISGFTFEHGTAAAGAEGIAITNRGKALANVRIENNLFRHSSLRTGAGMLHLRLVNGLTIRQNQFDTVHAGSGMRLGDSSNLLVENNSIRRVGRTGLMLMGVQGATIRSNVISDIQSQHGNGMSFYLDNRNIDVIGNCVHNAVRPLTFHGSGNPAIVNNLVFRSNVLVTNANGRAAIYSWGKNTNGVLIENNVATSPRKGMVLNGQDLNVTVRANSASGITSYPTVGTNFDISGNADTLLYAEHQNWTLGQQACEVATDDGNLSISTTS